MNRIQTAHGPDGRSTAFHALDVSNVESCLATLHALALVNTRECLDDVHVLIDLCARCRAALFPLPILPRQPSFCVMDSTIDDTWRSFRMLYETHVTRDMVVNVGELAAIWACFFHIHRSHTAPRERVGIAITYGNLGITLAYVVLSRERWGNDPLCRRSSYLPDDLTAFDPVALAGGHARPVDASFYGSGTTLFVWLDPLTTRACVEATDLQRKQLGG